MVYISTSPELGIKVNMKAIKKVTGRTSGRVFPLSPSVLLPGTLRQTHSFNIQAFEYLFDLPCFPQVSGACSTRNPLQQGGKETWVRPYLSLHFSSTFLIKYKFSDCHEDTPQVQPALQSHRSPLCQLS